MSARYTRMPEKALSPTLDRPLQGVALTRSPSLLPLKSFFYSARNARIASAVLATAIPSVRLSVRHTPVLCQNDGT